MIIIIRRIYHAIQSNHPLHTHKLNDITNANFLLMFKLQPFNKQTESTDHHGGRSQRIIAIESRL